MPIATSATAPAKNPRSSPSTDRYALEAWAMPTLAAAITQQAPATTRQLITNSNATSGNAARDEWAFWVMIATAFNAFAAIILAVVAIYQAIQVKDTKIQVAQQVRKMQGTLRVMKKQTELARKGYLQTTKLTRQNEAMVQAMRGQLNVMKQQLTETKTQNERLNESVQRERAINDPRLRVAEVTAENFEVGKRPFYVVTIANDGLIAATDVRIHMSIQINDETPMDWIHDVVVTIPANGKRHDFIPSSFWLSEEQLDSFEIGVTSLRVVGFFDYAPVGLTPFCYKYVPLQGEFRPAKIPQFVPCDYTPRLITTVTPDPAHHEHTAENILLVEERAKPEQEKGNEGGNDDSEQ